MQSLPQQNQDLGCCFFPHLQHSSESFSPLPALKATCIGHLNLQVTTSPKQTSTAQWRHHHKAKAPKTPNKSHLPPFPTQPHPSTQPHTLGWGPGSPRCSLKNPTKQMFCA